MIKMEFYTWVLWGLTVYVLSVLTYNHKAVVLILRRLAHKGDAKTASAVSIHTKTRIIKLVAFTPDRLFFHSKTHIYFFFCKLICKNGVSGRSDRSALGAAR